MTILVTALGVFLGHVLFVAAVVGLVLWVSR